MNANEKIILIAGVLGQRVSYFFTKQQRICLEVAKNFRKIGLPKYRKAINNLIKVLAKYAA